MKRLFVVAAALLALVAGPAAARAQTVVVNAANSTASLSSAQVQAIFLKKVKSFPNGAAATPVDQSGALRNTFSQKFLGKGASAVQAYWQQQIFSGAGVPPAEKAGDDAVLAFVRSNPGAIGYVSAGAALGSGVKAVTVQ